MVKPVIVVTANVHHRNLTTNERAPIAAKRGEGAETPPVISLNQAAERMGVYRGTVLSAKTVLGHVTEHRKACGVVARIPRDVAAVDLSTQEVRMIDDKDTLPSDAETSGLKPNADKKPETTPPPEDRQAEKDPSEQPS